MQGRSTDTRAQGDVSFQAYDDVVPSPNMNRSVIFDGDMHDLAADALDSPDAERHMGSLTGWQAIAAQVPARLSTQRPHPWCC